MARAEATTEGEAWDALRAALDAMARLAAMPRADMIDLAKTFAAVAKAMKQVAGSAGLSSPRFDAVVRALDLTTPKSKLAAFLED